MEVTMLMVISCIAARDSCLSVRTAESVIVCLLFTKFTIRRMEKETKKLGIMVSSSFFKMPVFLCAFGHVTDLPYINAFLFIKLS